MLKARLSLLAALTIYLLIPSLRSQEIISLAARQANFAEFIEDFGHSYAYLDQPSKPWLTWDSR